MILAQEPGESESDIWERLENSSEADPETEAIHLRAATRLQSHEAKSATQRCVKMKLSVRKRKQNKAKSATQSGPQQSAPQSNPPLEDPGASTSVQHSSSAEADIEVLDLDASAQNQDPSPEAAGIADPVNENTEKQPPKTSHHYVEYDYEEPFVVKNVVTKETVSSVRHAAIDKLEAALADRYSEFDKASNVLSKVKFVDVNTWPSDLVELSKYCVDDVRALLDHFQVPLQHAGIGSRVDILREFKDLKMEYGPRLAALKKSSDDFWGWVFQMEKKSGRFKNIFLLVELVLCLPFSTAICNCGEGFLFSQKNPY